MSRFRPFVIATTVIGLLVRSALTHAAGGSTITSSRMGRVYAGIQQNDWKLAGREVLPLIECSPRPQRHLITRLRYIYLFSLAVAVFAVLACSNTPSASDFRVGATREEVLESFGAPSRQQSLRKTSEAIWGPIEDFWSRVPLNSTVEMWAYRVEGGTVELYFIDQSEWVQGTGFAPEGAVFEGNE